MTRHTCRTDPCGFCEQRIHAAEEDRIFSMRDDDAADAAAADDFYGRSEW